VAPNGKATARFLDSAIDCLLILRSRASRSDEGALAPEERREARLRGEIQQTVTTGDFFEASSPPTKESIAWQCALNVTPWMVLLKPYWSMAWTELARLFGFL